MPAQAGLSGELLSLSRLFSYPETWPRAEDLDGLDPEAKEKWGQEPGPDGLEALQNQYVSLFINALPEVPCPPFGSVYLEGTIMGESTVGLKKLYAKYGLETDEMPDLIAVELEFLSFLADPVAHADPEDYQALLAHLRSWTPKFLERVRQNDESGFFKAVSCYAREMLSDS
ncbi:MAG: molecular chaperone TorD family protein [Deltaproteobacteria bacterium]|uniref:Molecular chaperone TorD family protein n=1 Tax=Candidatus Desulfacyla euxinica TaxID=2841693 RepID=A0A8J6T5P7_9DELT|nr:molecular chaperone TorD family protein [Candidatus Desulfacyla euxinica]